MTIHRFFVPPSSIKNDEIIFPQEIAKQITKVLRLQKGDNVIVLDGKQKEYKVMLTQLTNSQVLGKIISSNFNNSEPIISITLYQALIPREVFELVLQKGVEIGVSSFVPLQTKRTLIKKNDVKEEKIKRWERILQEAAEQSERGLIPVLKKAETFEEGIINALKEGPVFLAWEREEEKTLENILKELSQDLKNISIFIGPEGGFTDEEVEFARKQGAYSVTLGPRVLRSETAGLVMASILLFAKGEIDRKRAK